MDLQYITDTKGHKNGVLLSFNDWKKIQKNLDDFKKLKDKKNLYILTEKYPLY